MMAKATTFRVEKGIKTSELFLAFFEAFGLLLSFDAAMRDNKKRCGKESPTMAIEGDEAKMFNKSFWVSILKADRDDNNDDGGGDSSRLWTCRIPPLFNTSLYAMKETMVTSKRRGEREIQTFGF